MRIGQSNPQLVRVAMVLLLFGTASSAGAQEDLHALVSHMVQNELSVQKQQNYWMYLDRNTKPGKSEVERVIQTPQCWLSWPVSINGHPPTPQELQDQREKIHALVNDSNARRDAREKLEKDGKQAENLLKILPNAFLYSNDGHENGLLRLKFRPNPNFDPPTRAAKVFHQMAGTLLIDEKETRFAGMSGVLMSDVKFGWGVLGRLYKGGTFKVTQSELAPHDWEVTLLDVHMKGRALFFATIGDQQHEVKSDFQPPPLHLSLAQIASKLENTSPNVSASAAAGQ